jgi:putative SOS response-associated peptidase YedK
MRDGPSGSFSRTARVRCLSRYGHVRTTVLGAGKQSTRRHPLSVGYRPLFSAVCSCSRRHQDCDRSLSRRKDSRVGSRNLQAAQRHADAERALKAKHTKKAEADLGISSRKVEQLKGWLDGTKTFENKPDDVVVRAMNYGPVIIPTDKGRTLTAMRYHCRLAGKPASIDRQLPGLYNARLDSLEKWWAPVFGVKHALFVITGFRDNVKRHDMEHRELALNEAPQNVVLEFTPRDQQDMPVPCVWDRWQQAGDELNSFALITDEPPPEVAAAGHDRCPINLIAEAADQWLRPSAMTKSELLNVLARRRRPYYEHAQAEAA